MRKLIALVAVLALVAVSCGGETSETTLATSTTEAPTTTSAPETDPDPDPDPDAMEMLSDVGFDPETGTIKLGVLAATTGPIAGIGQSLLAGHQAYWGAVNAQGGVGGTYPVELIIRDNAYNPETNVVVYNEIKDEVLAFSSTIGTPTTATIYEDAAGEDLLVAAGSLASQWALTNNVVLNLASNTYFAQFANAPYWAMEIADPPVITDASVVGIVYQADDYGQDCKDGYDFAQENLGFNAAYEATYAATDTDYSAQVGGAQAAGVDVLFLCTLPTALATMAGTALAIQYSPVLFGSSPSYINVLLGALGGEGGAEAGAAAFNSFPFYNLGTSPTWESDLPGMQQMRAITEAAAVPTEAITAFYYFGFTQAQTFEQILLAAIENGDLTRKGLVSAVDLVQDVDFGLGGGAAGFGPTPKDRITTNLDAIAVATAGNQFGLEPVSDFFVAPYMSEWDPAG
ncbi:MAG: ABC transporter substrate-binding protein [Acidimicrobiia bacterium]|nr:ABC transporter substrate-binding protein [Acidimicrobiia bacterium]